MNRERVLADPEVRAAIDARAAQTGRPREIYERYITAPPDPGCTAEQAVRMRLDSLRAGPPPQRVIDALRDMAAPGAGTAAA